MFSTCDSWSPSIILSSDHWRLNWRQSTCQSISDLNTALCIRVHSLYVEIRYRIEYILTSSSFFIVTWITRIQYNWNSPVLTAILASAWLNDWAAFSGRERSRLVPSTDMIMAGFATLHPSLQSPTKSLYGVSGLILTYWNDTWLVNTLVTYRRLHYGNN